MNREELKKELILDEGLKLKAYKDSVGVLTIGCGHNLNEPISEIVALAILEDDISTVEAGLDRTFPWWRGLSEVRQRVMANMAFNLGIVRLMGFKRTMEAMRDGDFALAANEMLASKWSVQVGERARRLASMMRNG